MKLADVALAWTPSGAAKETAGLTTAGEHPDRTGWATKFMHAIGACDAEFVAGSDAERIAALYRAFVVIVVRDGIKPADAHEALSTVAEYREEIAPEIGDLEAADQQGADKRLKPAGQCR